MSGVPDPWATARTESPRFVPSLAYPFAEVWLAEEWIREAMAPPPSRPMPQAGWLAR